MLAYFLKWLRSGGWRGGGGGRGGGGEGRGEGGRGGGREGGREGERGINTVVKCGSLRVKEYLLTCD